MVNVLDIFQSSCKRENCTTFNGNTTTDHSTIFVFIPDHNNIVHAQNRILLRQYGKVFPKKQKDRKLIRLFDIFYRLSRISLIHKYLSNLLDIFIFQTRQIAFPLILFYKTRTDNTRALKNLPL